MSNEIPELSVSEFVSVLNQTLEYAYASVVIYGELADFRINKNRWVFFDLVDKESKVRFFGTVYNLPGPLENGMLIKVRGTPKLHPKYGFSISIMTITPSGTGSIKRVNDLLTEKLEREGLFRDERKRILPIAPHKIGLITSVESAAYADFIKILNNRWSGMEIDCIDVLVQGDLAPRQIISAIDYFSRLAQPPEVLVIIRGGGSPDDLATFNNEQVTRAVAASRVPTMVAIGHEIDVSLAELTADKRAATPSNAAELLVPDKAIVLRDLNLLRDRMFLLIRNKIVNLSNEVDHDSRELTKTIYDKLKNQKLNLERNESLFAALSPKDILKRGYAIIRQDGRVINGINLNPADNISIEMSRVELEAKVIIVKEVIND